MVLLGELRKTVVVVVGKEGLLLVLAESTSGLVAGDPCGHRTLDSGSTSMWTLG